MDHASREGEETARHLRCYYARAISLYGTPQSERDINTLRKLGFEVVDPNSPENEAAYKQRGMQHFRDIVRECDVLAFRSLPDGSIPAGVGAEIEEAKANDKPVIELPCALLRRALSPLATREYLRDVGHR